MALTFSTNWQVDSINEAGSVMLPVLTQASPSGLVRTCPGDIKRYTINLIATAPDTYFNRTIYLRLFQWAGVIPVQSSLTNGWQFTTGNAAGAFNGVMVHGDPIIQSKSNQISAVLTVAAGGLSATLAVTMYSTCDLNVWRPGNINNVNALFGTTNTGTPFNEEPISFATRGLANQMMFAVSVDDGVNPVAKVLTASGATSFNIQVSSRWFGRNVGSTAWEWRLQKLTVAVASQPTVNIADRTFAGLGYYKAHESNFIDSQTFTANAPGQLLSWFEDNLVTIVVARDIATAATITNVKVMLLRTDDVTNDVEAMSDFERDWAMIPVGDTSNTILSAGGKIASPSSRVQSPTTTLTVKFRIPKQTLISGGRYRILLNIYASATNNVFPLVSQEFRVLHYPKLFPKIKNWIANPYIEYATDRAETCYHDPVRFRTEIDTASVAEMFAYHGIVQDFGNVLYVRGDITKKALLDDYDDGFSVAPINRFLWSRANGLENGDPLYFYNSEGVFRAGFIHLIDEELTGQNYSTSHPGKLVRWEMGIQVGAPGIDDSLLKLTWFQYIDLRRWEGESPLSPADRIDLAVYRGSEWPALSPFTTFCGEDLAYLQATKQDFMADGISPRPAWFVPGIYTETAGIGKTDEALIHQNRQIGLGFIPDSTASEFSSPDIFFSSNQYESDQNKAVAPVIAGALSGQKYLTAHVRQRLTNIAPVVAISATSATWQTVRIGNITTVTVNITNFRAALNAATGATGGPFSPILFEVINPYTLNKVGINPAAGFSNPSILPDTIGVTVDSLFFQTLKKVRVRVLINPVYVLAETNWGGTNRAHNIEYIVEHEIPIPTIAGSASGFIPSTSFICNDKDA